MVGALALGCAPDLEDPDRFRNDPCNYDVPRALLRERCAVSGCHTAYEPQAGLDLESGGVGERLAGVEASTCVGRARIDAQNPEASYLLEMVSAEPNCDGTAVNGMPLGGVPLSDAERMCLSRWVAEIAAEHSDRPPPMATDAGPGGDGG